ncbi:BnaC05g19670D [Brassica napus]|uniref:BnaC05g19670D protein n=1 Tax=Brassica napus TaxID=3708 RepID=A0A078FJW0_BRANA|nr:BnaC05g19670D [Brassica napus]
MRSHSRNKGGEVDDNSNISRGRS